MNGLLIYNKEDYLNNISYVKWLIEEGANKGLNLDLMLKEDFIVNGTFGKDIDFVINRTRSYEISLIFELNNIRVFNNSTVTLLGNNKLAAYKFAKDKGYDFPEIYTSWEEKEKIISKPNNLHGGKGIDLVSNIDLNDGETRFQQKYMNKIKGDIRFYIIGNKIIHGVLRKSKNKIISNFTQGGEIEYYNYSGEEKQYIEKFIENIEIDYAGIDFFLTENNKLVFNEIEDVVGSRMLSELGINNTTQLYFEEIIKEMKKNS